jgi:hypothetical protein
LGSHCLPMPPQVRMACMNFPRLLAAKLSDGLGATAGRKTAQRQGSCAYTIPGSILALRCLAHVLIHGCDDCAQLTCTGGTAGTQRVHGGHTCSTWPWTCCPPSLPTWMRRQQPRR